MARRRDTAQAVGVLSRETRKRDRSDEAIKPLEEEAPVLTGRQVEQQVALERRAAATAVALPGLKNLSCFSVGVWTRIFNS